MALHLQTALPGELRAWWVAPARIWGTGCTGGVGAEGVQEVLKRGPPVHMAPSFPNEARLQGLGPRVPSLHRGRFSTGQLCLPAGDLMSWMVWERSRGIRLETASTGLHRAHQQTNALYFGCNDAENGKSTVQDELRHGQTFPGDSRGRVCMAHGGQ